MRVGLRVCVNTLRGALEGVPNLLRLFDEYQVKASFFFAMGPDNSGRVLNANGMPPWNADRSLLKRVRDFIKIPPNISRQAAQIMRSVAADGHETGLLGYDCRSWAMKSAFAGEEWTRETLRLATEAYATVFHEPPKSHAAAGWQVNPFLFVLEQEMGLTYASDTRGKTLFYPVLQGVESICPQVPTTLPSLAAMLSADGVSRENVHEYLYAESQYVLPNGHVYSLDAEMEGMEYLQVMEKLVVMWKGFGNDGLGRLDEAVSGLKQEGCRFHQVGWLAEEGTGIHQAWQSVPLP